MNFVLLIITLYTILYIFLSFLWDVKFLGNILSFWWAFSDKNREAFQFSSVAVVSDSLQPHGLQHARPPCLSPATRVYSDSCPLSRWCHPAISSPVVPFSSCLQSFPAPGSFLMSQFFISGGQGIGGATFSRVLFFLNTLLSMSLDALWLTMSYTLVVETDILLSPAWAPRLFPAILLGAFPSSLKESPHWLALTCWKLVGPPADV